MITLRIDKSIIKSDRFYDMPKTTQLLYFEFLVDADKDGMIQHPRTIVDGGGYGSDELKWLIQKGFVEEIDEGYDHNIYYIKDWKGK